MGKQWFYVAIAFSLVIAFLGAPWMVPIVFILVSIAGYFVEHFHDPEFYDWLTME